MIGNIKTGKRRAYQDIMQKVFRVEETTSDEEYEKAVRWFRLYEKELNNILKQTKEYVKMISTFFISSSLLCSTFHRNLDGSTSETKPEELNNVIGALSLSKGTEDKNQSIELVTLPSISQFLFENVQNPLNDVLMKEFPAVKKNIAFHNGLRKDLESYRRRVRKLQRNGRDVGDKELDKLVNKLKTTQIDYNNAHKDLISHIKRLCMEKQTILEPCFSALSVAQTRFSVELREALDFESLKGASRINEGLKLKKEKLEIKFKDEVETCRRRLDENKENVGTPAGKKTFTFRKLKKKFTPKIGKYKSLSFRGLTRNSSMTSHQLNDENPIIGAVEERKQIEVDETNQTETRLQTEYSTSMKQEQKRESVTSMFPDDTLSVGAPQQVASDTTTGYSKAEFSKTRQQVIDLDETDEDPFRRRLESVDDFSDDDDDIDSYFRN